MDLLGDGEFQTGWRNWGGSDGGGSDGGSGRGRGRSQGRWSGGSVVRSYELERRHVFDLIETEFGHVGADSHGNQQVLHFGFCGSN
jgi:hypothetical protein